MVWLHANYETAFSLETYDFLVRKGRKIAPLGTAARPNAPPSNRTSTSIVGFPRESKISRPIISTMLVCISRRYDAR